MYPDTELASGILEVARKIQERIQERAKAIDFVDHEPCCTLRLNRALHAGHQGDSWECPKCGCEWRAKQREGTAGTVRHWSAQPAIAVFR